MFAGLSAEQGLAMLKPIFKKEGIKTILLYQDENGDVKFEKLKLDVRTNFSEILLKFPETLAYIQSKDEHGK